MKKWLVFVLFSLVCVSSALAGESGIRPATATAAATLDAAVPAAPMTLAAALDKVARDYREMWIKDREGKRVKRACDFQCVQDCHYWRDLCEETRPYNECEQEWNICMCEMGCCWGPGGNPYCQ